VTNTIINRGSSAVNPRKVSLSNAWISSFDTRCKGAIRIFVATHRCFEALGGASGATLGKPCESLGNPLEDLDEVSVFGKFKFSLKHSGCLQPLMANTD